MHPQFFEASITILLATSLAAYTLANGRPGRARRIFLWVLGSVVLWAGGVATSRMVADVEGVTFWVQISFVGIFALPPAWYALAQHLTSSPDLDLTPRRTVLITLPSVAVGVMMATNEHHHLYMRAPELVGSTGPLVWGGPAFWTWVTWSYLLVCAGSIRYVRWSWRLVNEDARWRGALIGLASVLPLSGNVAHLLGLTSGDHDLTPLLLGAAMLALFFADWRFRMLDALPVARRDVIDHIRDGVIVADAQGVILDLNPAACEMVGGAASGLIGQSLVDVMAARSGERFDQDAALSQETILSMCQSTSGFDTRVVDDDGRHFEVRGATVADQVGAISGVYLIIREVTEQLRLDEVRRESRRAHSIASLAAGIAHEVNNPLAYIRGNVAHVGEMLDEWRPVLHAKEEEVDDLHSAIDDAMEGIDRIAAIVARLRQFTRTRGGARESIEVVPIVEEALRVCLPTGASSIVVERDLDRSLPPVYGVRDGLVEAIVNVIDNAQQALQETGGRICVRARGVDHRVRVEIEDDGPGIAESLREQIFEPFFSVGSNGFGAGLGLAIARKCVAELGGTIGYETADGGGACFVIELPRSRMSAP